MRVLIQFLTRGSAGATEIRERRYEGEALTLGRATDQILQIKDRRVALEHARISWRGGQPVITALGPARVIVNDSPVQETRLAPGDRVQLGANLLTIVEAAAGVDLALTFELDPGTRAQEQQGPQAPLRIGDSLLGMRSWSWLLFLLVLALVLAIPASGLVDAGWRDRLRATVLPSDQAWTAGPLASVHHVVAGQCEACHEKPFQRVRDEACLTCHAPALHAHADAATDHAAAVGRSQCTDCHREHDGTAVLLRTDDNTCATCHADLSAIDANTGVGGASDFLTHHPDFRASLVTMSRALSADAAPQWSRRIDRVALEPRAREDSGLKFTHDQHVATGGIRGPDGDVVLACADCHRPVATGASFEPIRMERDCAGCHRLDFDPAEPERVVPHGDAALAIDTLIEFYSRRYLQGFTDALAEPGVARRPGAVLSASERTVALERARHRAADAARDLIERRTCVDCHEVERGRSATGDETWLVRPVELTRRWLPEARFDHARHGTGLTPCGTCHKAEQSAAATDILMPDIETCRDCHAGSSTTAEAGNRVASGCMSCHAFHRPTQPLWSTPSLPVAVAR